MTALPFLLAQLAIILIVTTLCGLLLERFHQPRVIGEIAGGLLLGPLALGHVFPSIFAHLFPTTGLRPLETVSNIGLVLFLFLMGSELDFDTIRQNHGVTLAITLGSIAVPFALGIAISPTLRAHFASPNVTALGFTLFTGIAMSITALPVLARILRDRQQTPRAIASSIAATSLICAAANDLAAWSLLAIAITLTRNHQLGHDLTTTAIRLLTLLLYIALMLFLVRPLTRRLIAASAPNHRWLLLLAALALAFVSARITEALGVHAFLGAFLAGLCFPIASNITPSVQHTTERTLQPVIRYTLPIFFALTGLRLQHEMFTRASLGWFALILTIAVVGKIAGSALAARATGSPWHGAMQLGILMNTRGLVELIVLNVGYKEGILSPLLFTLFVLMALATTAMTVPLLDLLGPCTPPPHTA